MTDEGKGNNYANNHILRLGNRHLGNLHKVAVEEDIVLVDNHQGQVVLAAILEGVDLDILLVDLAGSLEVEVLADSLDYTHLDKALDLDHHKEVVQTDTEVVAVAVGQSLLGAQEASRSWAALVHIPHLRHIGMGEVRFDIRRSLHGRDSND